MTIIITLFYVSLVTIIAMVSWKLVSIRGLKLSLIEGIEHELHGKLYEKMHAAWHAFRENQFARARVFVTRIFYTILHELLRLTLILGQKLKARHGKWYDMVKGKGVVHKKGSVSFFLNDVSKYKKSLRSE